jgi:hypothetical protein
LNSNNIDPDTITLYRYTTTWKKLSTTKTNEDSSYSYYESTSPGMSYFAIKGDIVVVQEIPEETEEVPPQPTGEVIKETSSQKKETEITETKKGKFPWAIITIIVLGIVIVGGIIGFLYYQRNVTVLADAELRELTGYVMKCKAEGIDFKHIKKILLKAGWAEYIVDLVMHDVHIPGNEMKKLINYINSMKKDGKEDNKIRENLKKVGWQEEIINEAFDSISKPDKKK